MFVLSNYMIRIEDLFIDNIRTEKLLRCSIALLKHLTVLDKSIEINSKIMLDV
jgi:hypothetical protein